MHFFITNDDSHRSPLLHFLIDYLAQRGDLTIVVPKHEQSWRGKSITRFETLHVERIDLFGRMAYTVSGTPADCVNLGLYHLCAKAPTLVVSGINAGENTGTAFQLCSGTLGAAFEANLAGFPALALSQLFDSQMWSHYLPEYRLKPEVSERLIQQTKIILDAFFSTFCARPQFLQQAITWNINFPLRLHLPLSMKFAAPAKLVYGSLFKPIELGYEHCLTKPIIDDQDHGLSKSDSQLIRNGEVSMTLLDPHAFGRGASVDLGQIEREFISALH